MPGESESLNTFFNELQSRLTNTISDSPSKRQSKTDADLVYFTTPAPNAIEWTVGQKYGNVPSVYEHFRQYQIIRDFFQLRCPLSTCNGQTLNDKDCWNKSRETLDSENLLVWDQSAGEDVCPCCKSTRTELVQDGLLRLNSAIHLICGMRSGKSSLAGIIGAYVEHRIINIGHSIEGGLGKYFNQLPSQPFEVTFIASTDVQSQDTIWANYTSSRHNSPWIQKYIKWLKLQESAQTTQDGSKAWKYEELNKDINNGFLNVKFNSKNSNSGGLAGRTRLAAFIDELARFENTDSVRSADEAYRVLENSLRTIRQAALSTKAVPWLGTMVSISSPISEDDKAMRLLRQAPSIKNMYYGHYATWDFNPFQPRSAFDDAFEKDPIGAMRDFGARPPTAASPLIVDANRFRQLAIQPDLQPTATFKKFIYQDRTGREYISAKVDTAKLCTDGARYIAVDAGASFDQFAAACAHGEWVHTPEGRQLVTVFDWVFRLIPEATPPRDVWFDFIVQSIEQLSKYYNIGRVEFDRWNSLFMIQQLRDRGISCEMKGTPPEIFAKFINDVNFSRVRMLPILPADIGVEPPLMSAQGLAFYELEHLERSPDLKTISNPSKGQRRGYSDDTAIVVAHCNSMVQNSVVSLSTTHGPAIRLKREEASGNTWSNAGGSLYRPKQSRRGW